MISKYLENINSNNEINRFHVVKAVIDPFIQISRTKCHGARDF